MAAEPQPIRSAALRAAALPRVQETLRLAKDELPSDMLRLTEPRSEFFAAGEDSDGVQCTGPVTRLLDAPG